MKIRLIIPECTWPKDDWCSAESRKINSRIETLNHSMQKSDGIDLVVTSHNFFLFRVKSVSNIKEFIEKEIITRLKKIENKKPSIIGFDLKTTDARLNQDGAQIGGKKTGGIEFNPYEGIPAVVCYLKVENDSYVYETHIWECWQGQGECNQGGFKKQNEKRTFTLNGKTIGLLSCGDIASYCHDAGKMLPSVDIYTDLSHKSLRGHSSQLKTSPKLINPWKRSKYVLVTQQVQDVSNYLKNKRYPYIFPKKTNHKVERLPATGEREGVIVDVDIPFS